MPKVKIRICDALGVHSKQNPFPWKEKTTSEVQLHFSWGTLALRQGTAQNTKFPFWARIREKRTMHLRREVWTSNGACTTVVFSDFYPQQAGCHRKNPWPQCLQENWSCSLSPFCFFTRLRRSKTPELGLQTVWLCTCLEFWPIC